MTAATIPYLTPALLESEGSSLLGQIEALIPQAAPVISIVIPLLPLIAHIPAVAAAVQQVCNRINSLTGAVPTS